MAAPHGRTGCLEGEKQYIGIEPRQLDTFTIDLTEQIIEISDIARRIPSSHQVPFLYLSNANAIRRSSPFLGPSPCSPCSSLHVEQMLECR